ncbi:hypothetical protein FCV25MIE_28823 [Fagus crenata]
MAPPRKNSRNGLPSTEGTSDILQTIIQVIGGLTEVVQHQGPVSMFKLETYAEVVDRALVAERNCKRLSKTNDEELREEIQGPVSMFKLETYAEVVDRALVAERNCKRLSKTNDEERKPKSDLSSLSEMWKES